MIDFENPTICPTEFGWLLIEGPCTGDAQFLIDWLSAALKADAILDELLKSEPSLRERISRLQVIYCLEFRPVALAFVRMLFEGDGYFCTHAYSEWSEMFPALEACGFMSRTGNRYQMTIPQAISKSDMREALIATADTEDNESLLHTEQLLLTHSLSVATDWQKRLKALTPLWRGADRDILLAKAELH